MSGTRMAARGCTSKPGWALGLYLTRSLEGLAEVNVAEAGEPMVTSTSEGTGIRCWRGVAAVVVAAALLPWQLLGGTAAGVTSAPVRGPVTRIGTAMWACGTAVAVDPAGTTTAVWSGRRTVLAARRTAAGRWAAPVSIGVGYCPQVGVDRGGNVTAVWLRDRRGYTAGLASARRPVGGVWLDSVRVSADRRAPDYIPGDEGNFGVGAFNLNVSPGGAVAVTWDWGSMEDRPAFPLRIQARYRPAGQGWNAHVKSVSAPNSSHDPVSAIDSAGNVMVVYTQGWDGPLRARVRVAGDGWRPPVTVGRGWDPDIAMGPGGDATLVFTTSAGVRAARRPAGGPWTAPKTLGKPGSSAAEVVMDATGAATASWWRDHAIVVSRRPGGGAWSRPWLLAAAPPAGVRVGSRQTALNARGDILVTWVVSARHHRRLVGRFRGPGGAWTTRFNLAGPARHLHSVSTGVYPDGDLVAVWRIGGAVLTRHLFMK
jgi:hypothetical protein